MSEHRRCAERLPWYVNGTLAPDEVRRLEAHLTECADCRRELERCRALASLYDGAEELAPAPHPSRVARLWARAEAENVAPPSRFPWRIVALAEAAALIAMLAFGLHAARNVTPAVDAPARFRTLGDPSPPPARSDAVVLRVVFEPDTPERTIRRILRSLDATIVSGPTPLGVYTLAVPRRDEMENWSGLAIETLRKEDAVLLAEEVGEPDPGSP